MVLATHSVTKWQCKIFKILHARPSSFGRLFLSFFELALPPLLFILLNVRYPTTTPPPPPPWMKVRLKLAADGKDPVSNVKNLIHDQNLHTVCEEATCPNLGHCWSNGTATFLVMGDRCTRRCGFCDIATAKPMALDSAEPQRVANTVRSMQLKHAVITSVDRDDLKDCGSIHFASVIHEVKKLNPETSIEVLIPDFKGKEENLKRIWAEQPHIINHNVETVPSLYKEICPQSNYEVSLRVLKLSSDQGFWTKSGIILGLGEDVEQVRNTIRDLFENGVRLLTIGQYLQPSPQHAPLHSYAGLDTFSELKIYAETLGFKHVESGPLVRSSYHAGNVMSLLGSLKNNNDNHVEDRPIR